MPSILLIIGLLGLLSVLGGNLLVHTMGRRRLDAAHAFVDAPPVPATASIALQPFVIAGGSSPRERKPRITWRERLRRIPITSTTVFVACFVLYAVVGGILVLHFGSIVGDAQSRVADGWYVLFSRDPHLAAVGFVWAPLPSLLVLPILSLKSVFPVLSERAFAGNLGSALFMAGAVVQLRGALRELGTRRPVMIVLLLAFALNPMIVYYGANGMSEGFQLFFLLVGVRYLARWVRTREIPALVWSASAMGIGYLTRYEAIAAGAAGVGIVGAIAFVRARGPRTDRIRAASSDTLIYGLPIVAAFVGWAVVSYVITGHAFEYNSSQYGNSSQLHIIGSNFSEKNLGMPLPLFAIAQLVSFAPLLPLLLSGALSLAWLRRDARILAILPLGAVAAFAFFLFVSGSSFPWLRPYMPVLPLSLCCIAVIVTPPGAGLERPRVQGSQTPWLATKGMAGVAALLAVGMAVPSFVTTAMAMNDPKLGSGERQALAWVVYGKPDNKDQRAHMRLVSSVQSITKSIDALGLPSGSIVTDTFTPCVSMILMTSKNPHQFVITSDRDFQRTLADPPTFRARYLLVPPGELYGSLDAVNREYPKLYASGSGFAKKVKEFHEPGCPVFRLYKATTSPRR